MQLYEGAWCRRRDGKIVGQARAVTAVDGFSWLVGSTRHATDGKCIAGRFYDIVAIADAPEDGVVFPHEPAEEITMVKGGVYRLRNGEICGPVRREGELSSWPWVHTSSGRTWTDKGRFSPDAHQDGTAPDHKLDCVELIHVVAPAPVVAPVSEPEPVAAPAPEIKIVDGGYYRLRNGDIAGPMQILIACSFWPWTARGDERWTNNGRCSADHENGFPDHELDCVEFLGMEPPASEPAPADELTVPDFAEVEAAADEAVASFVNAKIFNGTIGIWTPLGTLTVNGSFHVTDDAVSGHIFAATFERLHLQEADLKRLAVHRRNEWVSLHSLILAAVRDEVA